MNINEIISALPTLKPKELEQLKAALSFLGKGNPSKEPKPKRVSEEEQMVYTALADGLAAAAPPMATFATTQYYPKFKQALSALARLIGEFTAAGATLPKAEIYALYRLLFALLTDDLKSRGVPISMGTMALNMHRIPEVLDAAYPGYRQSGMLKLIPAAMRRESAVPKRR